MKEVYCSNFFGRDVSSFLLGVSAKTGAKTWCFGGQLVVFCMVNVVFKQSVFRARKMRHGFWIYFEWFPFREYDSLHLNDKRSGKTSLMSLRYLYEDVVF
jgi:hypothetical protein